MALSKDKLEIIESEAWDAYYEEYEEEDEFSAAYQDKERNKF